jgi:hypothetical protein
MTRPPVSVLVIAVVYIAVGALGLVGHWPGIKGFHGEDIWIELTEAIAVVAGVFLLRRRIWAGWLALAWIAFHVILSAFHNVREMAIHLLFCALIAWALFHPGARRYFRGAQA